MKREMQGQMAFQNKIRALKQIELSKYGGKEPAAGPAGQTAGAEGVGGDQGPSRAHPEQKDDDVHQSPTQNQVSESLDQEMLWNPEDDDQIFDFLMEH